MVSGGLSVEDEENPGKLNVFWSLKLQTVSLQVSHFDIKIKLFGPLL